MISVFQENTPTLTYSWSVFLILFIVLVAIFINFRILMRKFHENQQDFNKNMTITTQGNTSFLNRLLNTSEFFTHCGLIVLLSLVFVYGNSEKQQNNDSQVSSMIQTIEKNNKLSGLKIIDDEPEKILCNDSYENSFNIISWETSTGKQKVGLLIGQKDESSNNCRFAVKETK